MEDQKQFVEFTGIGLEWRGGIEQPNDLDNIVTVIDDQHVLPGMVGEHSVYQILVPAVSDLCGGEALVISGWLGRFPGAEFFRLVNSRKINAFQPVL